MNRITKIVLATTALASLAACERIETGEVGVRRDFNKEIQTDELLPGSWNQTIVGDVMRFSVKDVSVELRNLTPLSSDNSTVKDFDLSVIYSINPASAAEIYIDKSRSFHAESEDGSTLLMYNYIGNLARAAVYKVARRYESLKMADNRAEIEQAIRQELMEQLEKEKMQTDISINQVMVRAITPADNIVRSANRLVEAQNELRRKEVEVQTAEAEARRIATLNANKGAVDYMAATALVNISEAVKEGKVNTIVIPHDFNGIVNVGNK
jgi:regulator of protease activity HflC (stomatin/prohibitin superfamily)